MDFSATRLKQHQISLFHCQPSRIDFSFPVWCLTFRIKNKTEVKINKGRNEVLKITLYPPCQTLKVLRDAPCSDEVKAIQKFKCEQLWMIQNFGIDQLLFFAKFPILCNFACQPISIDILTFNCFQLSRTAQQVTLSVSNSVSE